MASVRRWNICVGLSAEGRQAVSYAAAQHDRSIREWGADVIKSGAELACFADYLRDTASDAKDLSMEQLLELVRRVDRFKIDADPHPDRQPLPNDEVEAIAKRIAAPLKDLVTLEMGRHRGPLPNFRKRPPSKKKVTLCLSGDTHRLVLIAAAASGRTKRELVTDLLESAGSMGRVAGLKRQDSLCGGHGVGAGQIVDTWVEMLRAAGCICGDDDPGTLVARGKFRAALLDWYKRHSRPGVEVLAINPGEGRGSPESASSVIFPEEQL